jgi:PAS domain S-box-containing protein
VQHPYITERKQQESTRKLLATAVEQAAETILITDIDGTTVYANPAFEKTTGYTRSEAIGRNPKILKSGKHDAAFYRGFWETLHRGEMWSGLFVNRRKDGRLYDEEATVSPVRNPAGKVINYVAVKRDVTRERQLEARLRQAQKMESIGQLAAGVAHDFNNILAVIQIECDLLRTDGTPSDAQMEHAEAIGTATQRAAALIRQLLLFSRQESIQPRDLDLNQSVEDMTRMLRRILGENINLQLKFALNPLPVRADAGMIDQVLLNLAVNSRDAMPGGGLLVIETSSVEFDDSVRAHSPEASAGSFACLSVSDTGCGIEPDHLSRVFEPFFTTKDPGKGTGLGLATVFGIARQHRGWVNVYSDVGHGTTFRIYFPRLPGAPARIPQIPGVSAPAGHGETVLLVEDDAFLRASVRRTLTQAGYHVLAANNGVEALEVWNKNRDAIRLLLTDIGLPGGVGGKELGERLSREDPKLKVIYASGHSAEVAAIQFSLPHGIQFLGKPFQSLELIRTVRRLLEAGS